MDPLAPTAYFSSNNDVQQDLYNPNLVLNTNLGYSNNAQNYCAINYGEPKVLDNIYLENNAGGVQYYTDNSSIVDHLQQNQYNHEHSALPQYYNGLQDSTYINQTSSLPPSDQINYVPEELAKHDSPNKQNALTNGTKTKFKAKSRKKAEKVRQKPVSAYALFFREKQTQIKTTKPDASFGEVSKIVASEWEALPFDEKSRYKNKADNEKYRLLKSLATKKAFQLAGASGEAERIIDEPKPDGSSQVPKLDDTIEANLDWGSEFQNDEQPIQNTNICSNGTMEPNGIAYCIRDGCSNQAVNSVEWDKEYCSGECAVMHCRSVFQYYVSDRQP